MKSIPSSSSSSSSSFNENFCKSKGNVFGCFSGVLSRILCSKSLPTHPTDPIESEKKQHFPTIEKIGVDGSATPNVVARLMGLDSMSEISSNLSHMLPISITKSKSMDSEDFREETEEMQGQHRRVKTSVSFRETPDFFELEDDDFFVLNFENRDKNQMKGSTFGNSEVGIKGHKRRRRREKCGRKQRRNRDEQGKDRVFSNEERLTLKLSPQNPPKIDAIFYVQKQSYHLSPIKDKISSRKEEFDGIKPREKKNKENFLSTDEAECDSDNSSPVSVLGHITDFIISDPEVTTSEEDARLEGSESVNRNCTTSQSNENCQRETDGNGERNVGLKRRDYKKHENIEMLRRICRLAEAEVNNSNWKYRRLLRDDELEDSALDFGQGIFDQLVSELIDQLVGLECQEI